MKTSLPHSKKSEQMRNAYDGTAEYYDSRYKYIQYLKYGIMLHKLIIPHSLPQIGLPGPLLDNGGGTGLFIEFLHDLSSFLSGEKGKDERVNLILDFTCFLIRKEFEVDILSTLPTQIVICDISFGMLQMARKYQHSRELYGVIACDSAYLPFRSSQISTVTAFTVYQNIENIERAVCETSRVTADLGTLGTSVLKKSSNRLQFAELLGRFFDEIKPVHFEDMIGDFQKLIVQSDKYSQFHDLERVEDFFLTAKKNPRKEK